MSEAEYQDNIGELVNVLESQSLKLLSFSNLKYIFVMILVFSFIFMTLSNKAGTVVRRKTSRRNVLQTWNDDKRQKFKELTKKSVDIKDFSNYKPSDIENITLLNTLINAYISKVYEDLIGPSTNNSPPSETNTLSNKNNAEEDKSTLDCKNEPERDTLNLSVETADQKMSTQLLEPRNGKRRSRDTMSASNEMEQGSHIDCEFGDNLTSALSEAPANYRKRSILKFRRNVSFNLQRNQVKVFHSMGY